MVDKPLDALVMKQLVAVIDRRTTVVCLHAAGQIQPVGEPFNTLNGGLDAPPFHFGCRSFVVPWMPGAINEIRAEANAELMRRPLAQRRLGPGGQIGGRVPPVPRVPPANPLGTMQEVLDDFALELHRLERKILDEYRGQYYDGINSVMRQYGGDLAEALAAVERSGRFAGETAYERLLIEKAQELRRIIDQWSLPRGTTTYRGMKAWDGFPEGDMVGFSIDDAGFMSTSWSSEKAIDFATRSGGSAGRPVVLEIEVPAGTKAIPMEKALGESSELELLLNAGSRLIVKSDEIRTVKYRGRDEVVRWLKVRVQQ